VVRSDARENRARILQAAREALAEDGSASMNQIAQRAGVGPGTLYRNFPTRQDLFTSVYVGGVEELCDKARELYAMPPWEAFAAWLERFTDYVATKMAMKEALNKDSEMFSACRAAMFEASQPLFNRAQAAGEIRSDVDPDDAAWILYGYTLAGGHAHAVHGNAALGEFVAVADTLCRMFRPHPASPEETS
jgi:AcrR family transcriptional regulator